MISIFKKNNIEPIKAINEKLDPNLHQAMMEVEDSEAESVYNWLRKKGVRFKFGSDETVDLTKSQVILQCKMYIAALRIADDFGCDVFLFKKFLIFLEFRAIFSLKSV